MSLESRDTAGYEGRHIQVWVYVTGPMDSPQLAVKRRIKSASGFSPTGEKAEIKAAYLGYDVEQTIYGTTSFSLSIPMTVRDLVDLARAVGIDPATEKKIAVDKFRKVNFVCHHLDPETKEINYTECVGGFKARSFSDAKATGALDTTTIEGAPDLVIKGDGKVEIIEYIGNGTKTEFDLPAGATGVIAVENPKSVEIDSGWEYNAEGGVTPATPYVEFDDAPDDNSKVRIYFTVG